eukprot:Amastigsp_a508642_106.p5 type:complete len:100 gc:universal Amastigsp_a508642_106:943-644(-)
MTHIPSDHESARASYVVSLMRSGDMYALEPTRVCVWSFVSTLEMPRSQSLTSPFELSRMLAGLRSRCSTCSSSRRNASPRRTERTIGPMCASSMPPARR